MMTDPKQVEKRLAEIKVEKQKDFDLVKDDLKKVQKLKKSEFYANGDELIEHIANYKKFAICLKSNSIKEINEGEDVELKTALIEINDLKKLKKINKNVIKRNGKQIKGLGDFEKFMLFIEILKSLKKGEENGK